MEKKYLARFYKTWKNVVFMCVLFFFNRWESVKEILKPTYPSKGDVMMMMVIIFRKRWIHTERRETDKARERCELKSLKSDEKGPTIRLKNSG